MLNTGESSVTEKAHSWWVGPLTLEIESDEVLKAASARLRPNLSQLCLEDPIAQLSSKKTSQGLYLAIHEITVTQHPLCARLMDMLHWHPSLGRRA